jgi:predicted ferric reductase
MGKVTDSTFPDLSTIPNIDDIHANTSIANHDPFKFSHGLTGVDQQSNYFFVTLLLATISIPLLLALVHRLLTGIRNERRRVSVIAFPGNHDSHKKGVYWGPIKQCFFHTSSWANRRHHRLTYPKTSSTRFLIPQPQTLLVTVYVLSNFLYCATTRGQDEFRRVAELRGRSGTLAAFNLILTILCALRNNPLIPILHASYDTFNFFHRWLARLVVLQTIVHVFAFAYNAHQVIYDGQRGWNSISWVLRHSLSYRMGLSAFSAFVVLALHSVGPLRHAFYETFLTVHRLCVLVAISGIYFHLAEHALPQLSWIYLIIALLLLEPLLRIYRILYYNFSWKQRTWTQVTLEALPGDATRVTFILPRSWNANPGSHVHFYLPRIAMWSSHPFSVAWSQSLGYTRLVSDKYTSTANDLKHNEGPSTISCIIRARSGMTRILYDLVSKPASDSVVFWGAVEGPYGGHYTFDSYGTILLVAGGVGITHQLSFVRHLLTGYNSRTAAVQKVLLVWCIPALEVLEWIRPWLDELSTMENFCEVVRVRVYVSRTSSQDLALRPVLGYVVPVYVDVRAGRCDAQEVVDEEVVTQVGAMAVSVCGPRGFSDSVRAAVRRRACTRSVDLFVEAFSY